MLIMIVINTPEKKSLEKTSLKNTKSGAGAQSLPLCRRAKALVKGVFFHTPVAVRSLSATLARERERERESPAKQQAEASLLLLLLCIYFLYYYYYYHYH